MPKTHSCLSSLILSNITAIDVNCTDIDRKRDSKRHGGSAVLVDLENDGRIRTLSEDEIDKLLQKNIATRKANIPLDG